MLSRIPILGTTSGELPFGEGPQQRSYLAVRLDVGGGDDLLAVDTHLQDSDDPWTTEPQITTVLEAWGGVEPAVIAGDMNLQPEEDGVRLFLEAGLVSVQDEIGYPCEPTATDPDPDEPCDRVDWIFVTPGVEPSDFVIVETRASDHLPLAVTVTI